MRPLFALSIGLLFGAGLCLSGMTQPTKVLGFLDITGRWDPSLAFVMGGAIAIGLVLFHRARSRLPAPSARIDQALVAGSLLFGIGWGLVGFCPGPGVAALGVGEPKAVAFVVAMLAGMGLQRLFAETSIATRLLGGSISTTNDCTGGVTA